MVPHKRDGGSWAFTRPMLGVQCSCARPSPIAGSQPSSASRAPRRRNGSTATIVSRFVAVAGASAATGEGSEDRCPICYGQQYHLRVCRLEGCAFNVEVWLADAADEELLRARRHGLVSPGVLH